MSFLLHLHALREMAASTQVNKKYAVDCQFFHLWFSGNSANCNQKLVEILASRNLEELKLIRQTYGALYNQDLLYLFYTSQRNNKFARAAYLRISEPQERDAELVRVALFSTSPDLETLVAIICTRSSSDLQSIRQAYLARYSSNLEQDLAAKVNGYLKEVLLAMLNSIRMNGARIDTSMAMCDAKVIYEAMESGKSVDQKTIISLIRQRSTEQLQALFTSYKQLYGHELLKSLKREKCGKFGKELRIIIRCIQYPEKHFAKQVRRAMGNSNAREILIQTIITRSGIDIKEINKAFTAKTGWSLESLVRNEFNCSSNSSGKSTDKANGLAGDLLIALLKR